MWTGYSLLTFKKILGHESGKYDFEGLGNVELQDTKSKPPCNIKGGTSS